MQAQREPGTDGTVSGVGQVVLRVRGLTRRFERTLALDDVSLEFRSGDVHVLFGENGAGKSTLTSLLAGAIAPTGGDIEIDGMTRRFHSVAEARAHGVRAVFQEFSLIPYRTVAENITLGEEPLTGFGFLSKSAARAEARELIAQLGFDLDADAAVVSLTRGKQQMVEICKALRRPPRLLILDEPTASLSEHDARTLLGLTRRLRDRGAAIVYVTHRIHEIPLVGDRVSVLRDGRLVATVDARTRQDELIRLMTGRQMARMYPVARGALGEVRLRLDNVTLAPRPGHARVRGVDLEVRAGEIVGIAGLVGCGKSELAQACFGLQRLAEGEIAVDGRPGRASHPSVAIRNRLWYSPPDRRRDGLSMVRSTRENIALSSYAFGPLKGRWVNPGRETGLLQEVSRRVRFDRERLDDPVANLSGGNQQKVLLAKSMVQDISVYVLDEPTVGVDIGACISIYRHLADLSAQGAAILIASSNLPELLGLTHRIHVMSDGRLVAGFERDGFDEQRILAHFF